jgi:hypothetical protein
VAKTPAYTLQEVQWLRDNYPQHGVNYCAAHLKRTKDAIRHKVCYLQLPRYLKESTTEKTCDTCKQTKPLSEFTRRNTKNPKASSRALRRECKSCRALRQRKYYAANRQVIVARQCLRHSRLRRTSPTYALKQRLRIQLRSLLSDKKSLSVLVYLGCDIPTFKHHLEQQFQPNMSWGNLPQWDLDHIRPSSWFDLTQESEIHKCFHYTNIQPLWRKQNNAKRDHYAGHPLDPASQEHKK